jgi:hypothetical protein
MDMSPLRYLKRLCFSAIRFGTSRRWVIPLAVGLLVAVVASWSLQPRPWKTIHLPDRFNGDSAFSPDGRLLAVATEPQLDFERMLEPTPRTVRFLDLVTGEELTNWQQESQPMRFASSRDWFVFPEHVEAGEDFVVESVNPWTGRRHEVFRLTFDGSHIEFTRDYQTMLVTVDQGEGREAIEVWDLLRGGLRGVIAVPRHNNYQRRSLSHDGRWLAFSDGWKDAKAVEPCHVEIWDLMTCELSRNLSGYDHAVSNVEFFPDGTTLRFTLAERVGVRDVDGDFKLAEATPRHAFYDYPSGKRHVSEPERVEVRCYGEDRTEDLENHVRGFFPLCCFSFPDGDKSEYPAPGLRIDKQIGRPQTTNFCRSSWWPSWLSLPSWVNRFRESVELIDTRNEKRLWQRRSKIKIGPPYYAHMVAPDGEILAEVETSGTASKLTLWKVDDFRRPTWIAWPVGLGVMCLFWRILHQSVDVSRPQLPAPTETPSVGFRPGRIV